MKKNSLIGIAVVLVLVIGVAMYQLSFAKETNQSQQTIILNAVDVHPDDYPTTKSTKYFAKLLEERSHGRIKMNVYGSGQLGEGKVINEAMEKGIIDIGREGLDINVKKVPMVQAFTMPYLFRDSVHEWKVLDGEIGERLKVEMEKTGGKVVLAYYDSGMRGFYSKSPIQSPADLQGKTFRVLGGEVFKNVMDILQANSVNVAYNDIYQALQTGKIYGAENNIPSYVSAKHYEFAPYYTFDGHTAIPEILYITKSAWDKLSPEDQALLKECGAEAGQYQRKLWKEVTENGIKELQGKGVTFINPDTSAFSKAMEPLYSKYPQCLDLVKEIKNVK